MDTFNYKLEQSSPKEEELQPFLSQLWQKKKTQALCRWLLRKKVNGCLDNFLNMSVFVFVVVDDDDLTRCNWLIWFIFVALPVLGGFKVLVDGEEFQGFDTLTNVSVNLNGSVAVSRPQNNSFLVTFPSGISVTATEVTESLSIVFAAPVKFKGYTKGLLGTWNDDLHDDFLRPDGSTLPSNATGREIHFSFGLQCKLLV